MLILTCLLASDANSLAGQTVVEAPLPSMSGDDNMQLD